MTQDRAASVRALLLNRSREKGEPFQNLLLRYAIERLLYRMSVSAYADDFVLKGANVFYAWTGQMHRPSNDLDLLKLGESEPSRLREIMIEVLDVAVENDGLEFDRSSFRTNEIRANGIYAGVELKLTATLARAEIRIHIDFGVGDAVVPPAQSLEYPTLLEMPRPSLRAYRRETVVAEKFQAMVQLGLANSRLKDFYDLHVLAAQFTFEGQELTDAVASTFERRETPMPTTSPVAWTDEFSLDEAKRAQWASFLKKSGLQRFELFEAVALIAAFLEPVRDAVVNNSRLDQHWANREWRDIDDATEE